MRDSYPAILGRDAELAALSAAADAAGEEHGAFVVRRPLTGESCGRILSYFLDVSEQVCKASGRLRNRPAWTV